MRLVAALAVLLVATGLALAQYGSEPFSADGCFSGETLILFALPLRAAWAMESTASG